MAHAEQASFIARVKAALPRYFSNCRVLEIGSLDVNGSVRPLFSDCDYVGIDLMPGPGVDYVCAGQEFVDDRGFDAVVSCEVMEHNPYWRETFENMISLCRSGGLIIMTCATIGRPEHGTPDQDPAASPPTIKAGWNYYKNLGAGDFKRSFDCQRLFSSYGFCSNYVSSDLYFLGIRAGAAPSNGDARAIASIVKYQRRLTLRDSRALRRAVALTVLGEAGYRRVGMLVRPR